MLFRKAILLIHGFAGGTWDYGTLGNDLQLFLDFDVYTFTLPGHEKIMITKVTQDDWIKEAEKQLEIIINHGYKKIYLVGHSMGGVIACHLASKYPQVKKLVLASPAFRYLKFKDDKLDVLQSLKQTPALIKDYTFEVAISRAFKMSVHASKEFMKLVKIHHNDPKNINCPTLIVHGTNDLMAPLESASYVYRNLNSETVTLYKIKGANHDIFKGTKHDEVIKIVIDFLRTNNYSSKKQTFTI